MRGYILVQMITDLLIDLNLKLLKYWIMLAYSHDFCTLLCIYRDHKMIFSAYRFVKTLTQLMMASDSANGFSLL